MKAFTAKEKMLYCPKCQEKYEDSSQRFCNNDGGRLIPAPGSPKSSAPSGGVFSSLLGKTELPANNDEKLASLPRFTKSEQSNLPVYEVSLKNQKFREEPEVELELELEPPIPKPLNVTSPALVASEPKPVQPPKSDNREIPANNEILENKQNTTSESAEIPKPKIFEPFGKPVARIIKPSEIPSGTAEIGNRQTNPTGRAALTWKNPQVLVGASVKGRYQILELLGEDESSISYLAADNLVPYKKVVVRVLMDEESDDEFIKTIYAEERISLAHVDHPNIVKVIDSGELLEGKQFVVTEYIEADSVADVLKSSGQFNALRTARIIRQVAYALSEAHQNGILHRNLKPENLLLDVSEAGTEQVKLTNFGTSDTNTGDLNYKSPEIIEGRLATFAGDIYSLAIVAYQMLTGRLPFTGASARELLKAQNGGLKIHPTNLRLDLPSAVDDVLEKAMNYQPTERYPKARDFGDAFFNALNVSAPWDETASEEQIVETFPAKPKKEVTLLPVAGTETLLPKDQILDLGEINTEKSEPKIETQPEEAVLPIISDIHITPREEAIAEKMTEKLEAADAKTSDPAWTRRSPEPPPANSRNWWMISFFGLAIALLGLWAVWTYFLNRPSQNEVSNKAETTVQTQPTIETVAPIANQSSVLDAADLEETPPLPREIAQPPDTIFFENSKQSAKGDLLKNFLGFSLYYPKDWEMKSSPSDKLGTHGNFLDISRKNKDVAIEQMLVSYYDSNGTYKADAENFPRLVKESNETLKNLPIPNYQVLSEGEIKVNGGWRAYEIKFQGGGKILSGDQINLWGRRLFIPTGRSGVRRGYVITLLATSLSTEVKSVDDVGVKGELGKILETFEPNQNF